MRARSRVRAASLLTLLAAFACSDEPQGPGTVTATVEGPTPVGAALINLTGPGISNISAGGSTRVFTTVIRPDVYRVVAIGSSSTLRFTVDVEDLDAPLPAAALISASGVDNELISSLAGYEVRVRP